MQDAQIAELKVATDSPDRLSPEAKGVSCARLRKNTERLPPFKI
jgi:hypothetical protein